MKMEKEWKERSTAQQLIDAQPAKTQRNSNERLTFLSINCLSVAQLHRQLLHPVIGFRLVVGAIKMHFQVVRSERMKLVLLLFALFLLRLWFGDRLISFLS